MAFNDVDELCEKRVICSEEFLVVIVD